MTLVLKNPFTFTVGDYHKLAEVGILKDTDRVELLNGQIFTMSPIRSPHAGIVDDLFEMLVLKLHGKAVVRGQNPVQIDDFSEPEPDIAIAHYKSDKYRSAHPTPEELYLIIEVSDTTLERDQTVKMSLYANANIPEYWIVNLNDRQIEIHRQPKSGEYHFKQIISESGVVECKSFDFALQYDDVFIL